MTDDGDLIVVGHVDDTNVDIAAGARFACPSFCGNTALISLIFYEFYLSPTPDVLENINW